MATYSTGITATWNGNTFAEVTDLSWTYGGSLPKGRADNWTDDAGECTLSCLSVTGVATGNYGTRGTLTLTGGGVTLTHDAIYQGISVAAELNGVTRYTVSLRLLR